MSHFLLRCFACLLFAACLVPGAASLAHAKPPAAPAKTVKPATVNLDADDDAAPAKPAPAPAPPPAAPAADADSDEGEGENQGTESAGIECSPAISEVETRRPIPLSCAITKEGISQVELRYRVPGRPKWTKLRLRKSGQEFVGEIPCTSTAKRGVMKLSIVGLDANDKMLARIAGVEIQLVDASNEPAPALPGHDPPMRCYDPQECPPELQGSPACPGTKATPGLRSWGAACERTSECQKGLGCMSGTCEKPPKCDTSADCPAGECNAGTCSFPDPEEIASRLGPPKLNWIGLHFGLDAQFTRNAVGVCGTQTADSSSYDCFTGGDPYTGAASPSFQNSTNAGLQLATMRVMASYDRWLGRLALGARIGFAFNGAPKSFSPVHVEARLMYSLRQDPLSRRLRPYIGIAGGVAEVDTHSKVGIADCTDKTTPLADGKPCPTSSSVPTNAVARPLLLDAYSKGKGYFFGPTLGVVWALANDQAIQLNLNVMFPDIVLEPSLGYAFGL